MLFLSVLAGPWPCCHGLKMSAKGYLCHFSLNMLQLGECSHFLFSCVKLKSFTRTVWLPTGPACIGHGFKFCFMASPLSFTQCIAGFTLEPNYSQNSNHLSFFTLENWRGQFWLPCLFWIHVIIFILSCICTSGMFTWFCFAPLSR